MVKGIYLEVPFVKPQCPLKCAQPHLTPRLLQSPVKNFMTNVIPSMCYCCFAYICSYFYAKSSGFVHG